MRFDLAINTKTSICHTIRISVNASGSTLPGVLPRADITDWLVFLDLACPKRGKNVPTGFLYKYFNNSDSSFSVIRIWFYVPLHTRYSCGLHFSGNKLCKMMVMFLEMMDGNEGSEIDGLRSDDLSLIYQMLMTLTSSLMVFIGMPNLPNSLSFY